jgi:hypothetical protein
MTPHLREALPWIIIFIMILLLLAFFGWLGYEHWDNFT